MVLITQKVIGTRLDNGLYMIDVRSAPRDVQEEIDELASSAFSKMVVSIAPESTQSERVACQAVPVKERMESEELFREYRKQNPDSALRLHEWKETIYDKPVREDWQTDRDKPMVRVAVARQSDMKWLGAIALFNMDLIRPDPYVVSAVLLPIFRPPDEEGRAYSRLMTVGAMMWFLSNPIRFDDRSLMYIGDIRFPVDRPAFRAVRAHDFATKIEDGIAESVRVVAETLDRVEVLTSIRRREMPE